MKNIVQRTTLTSLIFLFVFAIQNAAGAAPASRLASINQHAVALLSDSVYMVQQGDTYYSLSQRFNLPIDSLQKWNRNKLQIGQTLYLTGQGDSASKAVASSKRRTKRRAVTTKNEATAVSQTGPSNNSTTVSVAPAPKTADFKTKSRVLVIPFDPHLYFSDADHEIARQSHIPRQNVRHIFRGRLNAMLAPEGYETIHLLGGVYRDSVSELSRVYESLNYGYQDNKQSRYNRQPQVVEEETVGAVAWVQRQKEKLGLQREPEEVPVAQDPNKHFGVEVKDPEFFSYFNNQYGIDYYVFINQFEVKTVYEHCLDRAAQNYERDFLVHYSIYDNKGKLVSGNKVKVPYHSNINDVQRIVSESMPGMARQVLSDLPAAK
ncbi:LysM domain-containing protein [Pontibacter ummariensis]|uniref:LysM domain-containing protein n=1 Tax=Pontibacter ummariensis TaxID=1610492 RepID=A0A239E606_9BACT|nr:LysM peptidoglycan-binding domain-containing protein [Pontibacter ummariensis]PRY13100.1 LysM domain-containing protein [Pontibacter ummariensis]SNS40067.1 LysM domain-containing protein [Pontibacter ummariensis]